MIISNSKVVILTIHSPMTTTMTEKQNNLYPTIAERLCIIHLGTCMCALGF